MLTQYATWLRNQKQSIQKRPIIDVLKNFINSIPIALTKCDFMGKQYNKPIVKNTNSTTFESDKHM